jgi:predicted membrane channel-forming protein YqfA (hemolysin III family)
MTGRARKLLGGAIMLIFVATYALIAMALADTRPLQEASGLVRTLSYVVLGLAWVAPLMPLIRWMERPDPRT